MNITSGFKSAAAKIGLVMIAIVALRVLDDIASYGLMQIPGLADTEAMSYLPSVVSLVFIYFGGIISAMLILGVKLSDVLPLYKNKQRLGKAVTWFIPAYGAGQIMNFAVLIISFLIAGNKSAVQETYSPIIAGADGTSRIYMIFMAFQLVVLAPVFEEFWFRGVIQTALDGYGHGFAIIMSAVLFGLTHGNIHQFCYATVIGIVLGYVRYATGGMLAGTIIHAILNSFTALILLLLSSEPVLSGFAKLQQSAQLNDAESGMFAVLGVFMLAIIILIIVGIISAINKLRNNRLYRPAVNYGEMTKREKFIALCRNPLFVIGFLLFIAYILLYMFI